jgi:hypothetical protein
MKGDVVVLEKRRGRKQKKTRNLVERRDDMARGREEGEGCQRACACHIDPISKHLEAARRMRGRQLPSRLLPSVC